MQPDNDNQKLLSRNILQGSITRPGLYSHAPTKTHGQTFVEMQIVFVLPSTMYLVGMLIYMTM